jgi:hypothetical protein
MNRVLAALEPLDDEARLRVLTWVSGRYDLAPVARPQAIVEEAAEEAADIPTAPSASASQFQNLGELFGAANPRTNGEKALVAGYWLQVKGGAEDLTSQAVNTELKHLGHGVANITAALEELKSARPALAIQLRKSGSSQQARKKYKITAAGEKRVEALVANGGQE